MTINHSSADQRTMRIIAQLREDKARAEQLIEDVCKLIPEEEADDVAIEAVILTWVTAVVFERDKLRQTMREVADSSFMPRHLREVLLEALPVEEV
jgi:hypothetical protein